MSDLDFDGISEGWKKILLCNVAPRVWEQAEVKAMWVVGSLARGTADAHSDVDLWIAVDPDVLDAWREPDWALFLDVAVVGRMFIPVGEAMIHSLLLDNGEYFDFCVQHTGGEVGPSAICVLGCREEAFGNRLAAAAEKGDPPFPQIDGGRVAQMVTTFWVMTHKHRKVLERGLDVLSCIGVRQEQSNLLELLYILETGENVRGGPIGGVTVNALTKMIRSAEEAVPDKLEALTVGKSLETEEGLFRAIEGVRDEVSVVGRRLAEKYGFEYPDPLEAMVRQCWEAFRAGR